MVKYPTLRACGRSGALPRAYRDLAPTIGLDCVDQIADGADNADQCEDARRDFGSTDNVIRWEGNRMMITFPVNVPCVVLYINFEVNCLGKMLLQV